MLAGESTDTATLTRPYRVITSMRQSFRSTRLGVVRFGSVWFFNGFWRTLNQTIGSVQNGQVLVLKWSKP